MISAPNMLIISANLACDVDCYTKGADLGLNFQGGGGGRRASGLETSSSIWPGEKLSKGECVSGEPVVTISKPGRDAAKKKKGAGAGWSAARVAGGGPPGGRGCAWFLVRPGGRAV